MEGLRAMPENVQRYSVAWQQFLVAKKAMLAEYDRALVHSKDRVLRPPPLFRGGLSCVRSNPAWRRAVQTLARFRVLFLGRSYHAVHPRSFARCLAPLPAP